MVIIELYFQQNNDCSGRYNWLSTVALERYVKHLIFKCRSDTYPVPGFTHHAVVCPVVPQ